MIIGAQRERGPVCLGVRAHSLSSLVGRLFGYDGTLRSFDKALFDLAQRRGAYDYVATTNGRWGLFGLHLTGDVMAVVAFIALL